MSVSAPAYPDDVSALMAFIRERPEVQAIKPSMPVLAELDKRPAGYAVLVLEAGGEGKLPDTPMYEAIRELRCYGPDKRTATLLARTLVPLLVPEHRNGFVRRGCVVTSVATAGAWVLLQEPDGTWFARQPLRVRFKTVPVPNDRTVN